MPSLQMCTWEAIGMDLTLEIKIEKEYNAGATWEWDLAELCLQSHVRYHLEPFRKKGSRNFIGGWSLSQRNILPIVSVNQFCILIGLEKCKFVTLVWWCFLSQKWK